MLVLFRQNQTVNVYEPIVILDYTRSDEQWTKSDIKRWVNAAKPAGAPVASTTQVFSLDSEMTYTHSGVNYGDSLKTRFSAKIVNPPYNLVTLLNIQQYTSQQNLTALTQPIADILDPQVVFPTGKFVIKDLEGNEISRDVIIYSTPFTFDPTRVASKLELKGSTFESMVMNLQFAINLKKSEALIPQLQNALGAQGYTVTANTPNLDSVKPVLDRYYAPAPINSVLAQVCLDNNLGFSILNKGIRIQSLSYNTPPRPDVVERFCFMNTVPNTKIIVSFNPENYANGEFETELFDPVLYSSVAVFDDTGEAEFFANMSTIPELVNRGVGGNMVSAYRFYLTEYTLFDSRQKTTATFRGSNNWLMNNFKLDTLLENKIYGRALT